MFRRWGFSKEKLSLVDNLQKITHKSKQLVANQIPLSCPKRPVKLVHFSNALADDTNASLDDSMSVLIHCVNKLKPSFKKIFTVF